MRGNDNSLPFIEKHKDKVNWRLIGNNQDIFKEFKEKYHCMF